ncbi:MAG: relaxase/mobilization nuclease domain-containing protein [Longicatena sp.]|uniref:relaxase/mobilization nuclease domain-containing protein n=1 Tax=Anaerorhabdus sp. TaxID=1872524 RepID=UPI002FC856FE
MATTALWKVVSRMDHVIDYVIDENKTIELQQVLNYTTNEEKTMEHQYVSCINCMQHNPYQSMINTKEQFHDNKKILCFHGYQSFAEGEVTPELAHQIGVELAEKLWGSRFEVVVTTHLNTDNIHNHFVLNATSCIDGKRYCHTKKDLYNLRTASDDLCRQYGLSVIEEKAYQSKTRQQYYHKKSLESLIRNDIDEAIKVSTTRTNFFNQLQFEGYEIKQDNTGIALKHHAHEQWIVLSSLGKEYSQVSIDNKILSQQFPISNKDIYSKKGFDIQPYWQKYKSKELKCFLKMYIGYQDRLGILPKLNNKKPKYSKELKLAIKEMDNISDETILLCKNNIETFEQLKQYQEPLEEQYNDLISKRVQCRNKIRRCPESTLKEQLKTEAKSYTPKIQELRKQIQHCEKIKERSLRMQQFELETQTINEKGRTRL